jgi:hypothetical protein
LPGKRTLTAQLGNPASNGGTALPGKRALTDDLPIQRRGAGPVTAQDPRATVAAGVSGHAPLPHEAEIQQAFGRHDVSGVRATVGGPAKDATAALGAHAYAHGEHVAFREQPDR